MRINRMDDSNELGAMPPAITKDGLGKVASDERPIKKQPSDAEADGSDHENSDG